MLPMGKTIHSKLRLEGFEWLEEKRPKNKFEITGDKDWSFRLRELGVIDTSQEQSVEQPIIIEDSSLQVTMPKLPDSTEKPSSSTDLKKSKMGKGKPSMTAPNIPLKEEDPSTDKKSKMKKGKRTTSTKESGEMKEKKSK